MVGTLLESLLHTNHRPYGVEVVGDPFTALAAASPRPGFSGRGWQFMRWGARQSLRQICRRAAAVAYVTSDYLQRRYPPGPETITSTYSSIQLPEEAFVAEPRVFISGKRTWRFISVGTMSQPYKGQQVLIDALAIARDHGVDAHLTLVGDGQQRRILENQVARRKITNSVTFAGQISQGQAVRNRLDQADLFVLPSFSEGLPRAMIEAQARGLPCIGTRVGGIPELLEPSEMVAAHDPAALASLLGKLTRDPRRMTDMAANNLRKARAFASTTLQSRRAAFYRYLKSVCVCAPIDCGLVPAA